MKSRIAALALAAACVVIGGQPAYADNVWSGHPYANCPQGTVTGSLTSYHAVSATDVSLTGTITPCAVQSPAVYFGYLVFDQYNAHDAGPLLPYGSTATSDASATLHQTTWSSFRAVCLAASPTDRVACLSVTMVNGLPTLAPIPLTDPRVTLPYKSPEDGHGNCATCL